jgi:hypothetical protein
MRSIDLRVGPFRPLKILCLAVLTSMSFAIAVAQSQVGNGLPYPPPEPGMPPMNQTANPTADANRLMEDSFKHQDHTREIESFNVKRQSNMTSDMARLIELAHQLKIETDEGAPATFPELQIQQAEQIEKLAHSIQHKMRASE